MAKAKATPKKARSVETLKKLYADSFTNWLAQSEAVRVQERIRERMYNASQDIKHELVKAIEAESKIMEAK